MDDSYLSGRVDCHEHNEDGWCYWLKPGWFTPEGESLVCEETKAEAIAALKTAYQWGDRK